MQNYFVCINILTNDSYLTSYIYKPEAIVYYILLVVWNGTQALLHLSWCPFGLLLFVFLVFSENEQNKETFLKPWNVFCFF